MVITSVMTWWVGYGYYPWLQICSHTLPIWVGYPYPWVKLPSLEESKGISSSRNQDVIKYLVVKFVVKGYPFVYVVGNIIGHEASQVIVPSMKIEPNLRAFLIKCLELLKWRLPYSNKFDISIFFNSSSSLDGVRLGPMLEECQGKRLV
jgi:hypothetical protein